MRTPTLFALILLSVLSLPALAQDTTWFDGGWKETPTADRAKFFRIKTKSDQGWQVRDYWITGELQMTGTFADDSCKIRQGEFAYYDEKYLIRRVNYIADNEAGKETYYYDNGHVRAEGNKKEGKYDGEWKGYYRSGKPSGQALYDTGRQVSAKFFDEDGKPNKKIKEFFRESEYARGPAGFLRYLNKNIKYPEDAFKNKVAGTPIVEFVVSKDGTVIRAWVTNEVDKTLAEEALRVIRASSDWQPAILGGTPIDSYKKQPIVFRLD